MPIETKTPRPADALLRKVPARLVPAHTMANGASLPDYWVTEDVMHEGKQFTGFGYTMEEAVEDLRHQVVDYLALNLR